MVVADLRGARRRSLHDAQKVSRASQQTRHCKTAVLVDECHRSYADEQVWRRLDEALGAPSLIVRFRAQIRFDASARWRDGVDCTQVGFTATPEDRELATLGNPLHCFPLSSAIQHGFVLDVLRDFRAPRLPVTVLDAVSKRPVDDARLRRLALETAQVVQAKAAHAALEIRAVSTRPRPGPWSSADRGAVATWTRSPGASSCGRTARSPVPATASTSPSSTPKALNEAEVVVVAASRGGPRRPAARLLDRGPPRQLAAPSSRSTRA